MFLTGLFNFSHLQLQLKPARLAARCMSVPKSVIRTPTEHRLQDVAELLAQGLKRAQLRGSAQDIRESSTGLWAPTERVSGPENRE